MSVETMIQVAVVRADMALCAIGRALVGFAAVAACVGVIVILNRLLWRAIYDRDRAGRH